MKFPRWGNKNGCNRAMRLGDEGAVTENPGGVSGLRIRCELCSTDTSLACLNSVHVGWSSRVSGSECPSLRSTRLGDARREAVLEAYQKHASLLPYPLLFPSLKAWLLQTWRSVMSFDRVRARLLQSSHGCYNSAAKPSVSCDVGLRSLVGFCQLPTKERWFGLQSISGSQTPHIHLRMLRIENLKCKKFNLGYTQMWCSNNLNSLFIVSFFHDLPWEYARHQTTILRSESS